MRNNRFNVIKSEAVEEALTHSKLLHMHVEESTSDTSWTQHMLFFRVDVHTLPSRISYELRAYGDTAEEWGDIRFMYSVSDVVQFGQLRDMVEKEILQAFECKVIDYMDIIYGSEIIKNIDTLVKL